MMAARRFAAVSCRAADHFVASLEATNCRAVDHLVASLEAANCRAADHFVASLEAGLNHDSLRASRRASTRAGRCVAERHRFEACQVVASPAAASCLATADRPGASLGRPPVGAALRGARPARTIVRDRAIVTSRARHRIAFRCAEVALITRGGLLVFFVPFDSCVQRDRASHLSSCSLDSRGRDGGACDALRRSVIGHAREGRSIRSFELRVVGADSSAVRIISSRSDRRIRPLAVTATRAVSRIWRRYHGAGVSQPSPRSPAKYNGRFESCARLCRGRPRQTASA